MRILVLAPFGRNADVLCRVVGDGGMACTVCRDVDELIGEMKLGAGVIVLTTEALQPTTVERFGAVLDDQPGWSDLPLIVFADDRELLQSEANQLAMFRRSGSVMLLGRPARAFTLLTVLQSALRARSRQYEIRDLLERELNARRDAEQLNQIKDEFLATVSHELGTPLSAILLWTRLAMSGRVPAAELPAAIEHIHRSACAQSKLIDDLLDLARITAGKLVIVPTQTELAPAVEGAIDVVRPSAGAKRVRLELAIDPAAGTVSADLNRMQQVVWNVLSNAVKFTAAGGSIRVSLQREDDHVRLQVSDTGRGISPDFIAHVFEPFRQENASSTRPHAGLGLGLSIAKQLVELHGGTISAESAGAMKGTTFLIRLPLVRP
jgi:signal transduction histidine kinase